MVMVDGQHCGAQSRLVVVGNGRLGVVEMESRIRWEVPRAVEAVVVEVASKERSVCAEHAAGFPLSPHQAQSLTPVPKQRPCLHGQHGNSAINFYLLLPIEPSTLYLNSVAHRVPLASGDRVAAHER
jgi:hypothetical protein